MRQDRQLRSPRFGCDSRPPLAQSILILPPERHVPLFKQVLKRIDVQSLGLTPAALRDRDTTDFKLRTRDVLALLRRGR